MFKKEIKTEINALKLWLSELETKVNELLSPEYFEWKSMAAANKDTAAKQGHFYLNSKTDTQLLEQIISEINTNEDLCALLTTSDGTTLSLRVHPQPKNIQNKSSLMRFNGDEE